MIARIGFIGCGWWATRAHLPAIDANPDAMIAGLAEPNKGNRVRAAQHFGVPGERVFASAAEMLDQVELDAAIVAVPHVAHAEVSRIVLERGLHVLIEKPMTLEPEDARTLAQIAEARQVEIIVGYPWHYNRQAIMLRDAISDGRIGRIEYVSCLFASTVRELYRGNPEAYREFLANPVNPPGERTYADPRLAGGGQGHTQVTHSAALLFFLTGLRPAAVSAFAEAFELAVDLADAAIIRFSSGAIGSLGSTGSVFPSQSEILEYRIFGATGHVVFDVNQGRAVVCGRDGTVELLPSLSAEERYPEWAPATNLVDIALGRSDNGSPASIGVLTVEFVDALYRSAREGRLTPVTGRKLPDDRTD